MLVGEVFARMGLDSKQYEKGLDRLEGYTKKRALTLGSIFKGAFSFALGIGVIQGFRSLGGAITDFVNTAARTEVLDIAMQSVAKSSGYAIAALREQRKSVMELGIAEQEATQILTRFMQAQLDTADAAKLARVAQDAAVISGTNSSQAAEQMTEAIAKQRPELLSAFGMTRNMNEIYKDYAVTIGKTAAQLSEAEKKQAMLNYILAEGEKIAGTYEASMGVVGKQISSLPRYWDTLKNAIAKPLALPAISVFVEALTNGLKNAIRWAETSQAVLQRWGQAAASAVQKVMRLVSGLFQLWVKWWKLMIVPTLGFQKVILRLVLYFFVFFKAVALAKIITQRFAYVMGILRGQTYVTGGAFGFLSAAVQYYRYQLKLANMAGITSLGVMAKTVIGIRSIGVAIKGLLASIPVIGWIVLAVGLLAEAAIYAYNNWEKVKHYILQVWSGIKQGIAYYVYGILSLYRLLFGWIPGAGAAFDVMRKKALEIARAETAIRQARAQGFGTKAADPYAEYEKKMEEYYAQMEDYGGAADDSLSGVQDGVEDTTEGIKDMNKAAKGGLHAFDEIHQLMKETGGLAGDGLGLDGIGLGEMPVMAGMPEMPKMPEIDTAGFAEKISGMWGDIKAGASAAWSDMWSETLGTMAEAKDAFLSDPFWVAAGRIWDKVKIGWGNFVTWAQGKLGSFWDSIKTKWDNFKIWAGNFWDNVKISWNSFTTWAQGKWNIFWDPIKKKWDSFKIWAGNFWDNSKIAWNNFKIDFEGKWGKFWEPIQEKWDAFKTWVKEFWEDPKKKFKDAIDYLKGLFNFEWKLPKIKLPRFSVSWSTEGFWGKVGEFLGMPGKPILDVTWLARGGLVTAPTLAMLGESGSEAVLPLDRNTGWIDQLAEKIASALTSALQTQQSGAALDGPVAIYLQVDKTMLGKITARSLRELQRQGGGALIPV